MRATPDLLQVWNTFDRHPMETLTKAWMLSQPSGGKQRSVELMKEHRHQYGTSGNCFDLAIWLIHEFKSNGISAYAIGHDLNTPEAHVAVIAVNEQGYAYFCDLGDQWIEPILVDPGSEEYTEEALEGFTTGGKIRIVTDARHITFSYIRPNGKISKQSFHLKPVSSEELWTAANVSQALLRYPLVEMRIPQTDEIVHWEFDKWSSFISSNHGLTMESMLEDNEQWAERIHQRTGMSKSVIVQALDVYSNLGSNPS